MNLHQAAFLVHKQISDGIGAIRADVVLIQEEALDALVPFEGLAKQHDSLGSELIAAQVENFNRRVVDESLGQRHRTFDFQGVAT